MFKAEAAGINKEVKIIFDGNEQIYTLDLSEYTDTQRQGMAQILMFAAPGEVSGSGTYYILDAYFSNTFDGTNVARPVNQYNGTDSSFGINQHWHDGGDGVYNVTSEASPWVVEYNKGNNEYPALKTLVAGKFGNFTKIRFGVKVDEGKTIMIKAANGCEVTVTGTGAYDDSYELDLTTLSEAQRDAITEVIIFAEPGTANVSGTFEIHWMSFNDFEAQDTSTTNVYDGTSGSFGCNAHWYSGDPGVYTTEGTGPVVVNYTKAKDQTYPALKTNVVGKLGNFKTLNFGVLVPEGKEIIIKVAHIEVRVTGTGEYDGSYSLDLSGLTVDQRNAIREVLIMAEPGTDNVSGTFEIHWMSFNA
jgi:hypothetical protein